MTQQIDNSIFQELEEEMQKKEKKENTVNNEGESPKGSWIEKITSRINISDLAQEKGITECPKCHYPIQFNDNRGWFICTRAKYQPKECGFSGNIVDFVNEVGGLR